VSESRKSKLKVSEIVSLAGLLLGIVVLLSMVGMLVGPRLWEMYGPATPTHEPEWRDIRQIYTPSDTMVGCVDTTLQLGPAQEKLYFYSAMSVALEMDLIPGMSEKENLDDFRVAWIWSSEEGLKYALVVEGAVALEFELLCTIPNEDNSGPGLIVFESVEIKTLDR